MENNINEKDLNNFYYLLLARYTEIFNIENAFSVFPPDINILDILTKIEVLIEAIKTNKKVEDTEIYKQFIKENINKIT